MTKFYVIEHVFKDSLEVWYRGSVKDIQKVFQSLIDLKEKEIFLVEINGSNQTKTRVFNWKKLSSFPMPSNLRICTFCMRYGFVTNCLQCHKKTWDVEDEPKLLREPS